MSTYKLAKSVVCLGCVTLLGCSEGSLSFSYAEHDPPPRVVVVEPTHICTSGCGHYFHEGHYVVVKRGHHHGANCGHAFDGRRWVVAVSGPAGHVHVESGGSAKHVATAPVRAVRIPPPPGSVNAYVYDRRGSKWLRVSGRHVHGPSCGHVHVEGHWCMP